jgi:hypothetical protein
MKRALLATGAALLFSSAGLANALVTLLPEPGTLLLLALGLAFLGLGFTLLFPDGLPRALYRFPHPRRRVRKIQPIDPQRP